MSFEMPWGIQNICAGLEGVLQDPWENQTFVEGQMDVRSKEICNGIRYLCLSNHLEPSETHILEYTFSICRHLHDNCKSKVFYSNWRSMA